MDIVYGNRSFFDLDDGISSLTKELPKPKVNKNKERLRNIIKDIRGVKDGKKMPYFDEDVLKTMAAIDAIRGLENEGRGYKISRGESRGTRVESRSRVDCGHGAGDHRDPKVSSVINVKSEGKAKDLKAFLFGDYFMSSKMVKNNEIDSSVPVRRMDKNTFHDVTHDKTHHSKMDLKTMLFGNGWKRGQRNPTQDIPATSEVDIKNNNKIINKKGIPKLNDFAAAPRSLSPNRSRSKQRSVNAPARRVREAWVHTDTPLQSEDSELARFSDCRNLLNCLVKVSAAYEARSSRELSLYPGLIIKQKKPANQDGFAFGSAKIYGFKQYGLYPVDHVQLYRI